MISGGGLVITISGGPCDHDLGGGLVIMISGGPCDHDLGALKSTLIMVLFSDWAIKSTIIMGLFSDGAL